ncbi:MAG: hypothetical protein D6702_01490 [Planctomycetota bacterium]|nr:MAG: hypothetical protein D6702_01490 [Planctomycetota bacterium]
MILLALLLGCAGPPQEPQEPAPEPVRVELRAEWERLESTEEGDRVIYRFHRLAAASADEQEPFRLRADRLDLSFDRLSWRALLGDPEAAAERAAHPLPEPPPVSGLLARLWSDRLLDRLGLPAGVRSALLEARLSGSVRIEAGGLELACAELVHEPPRGTTALTDADLFLPVGQGPNGWPLRVIAAALTEAEDGSLEAREAALTTCDEQIPHYALQVSVLRGRPAGGSYAWDPEGGWLALGGRRLLPLPTPAFGGGAGDSLLSLHGVRLGSNSRDGQSVELDLRGGAPVGGEGRADWRLLPGWRSRRGLPLAAELALRTPEWTADWELFGLRDQGEDRHRLARTVRRPDDTRYRARLWNRFPLGDSWRLDLDLALTSDPLVDPEFFEARWREQDDALSEAYLHHAGAGSLFEARAEGRLDRVGFTPLQGFGPPGGNPPRILESLPVVRWQAFPRTVATLPAGPLGGADGRAALHLAWGAEVGRFRLRDRDLLAAAGRPAFRSRPALERDRLRAWLETSLSLHLGGVFLRPGARFQGLAYDQGPAVGGAADRTLAEGFVEAGLVLLRDWEHGWQHRVLPQARLRKLSTGGDPAGRLPGFDTWDGLRAGEALELGLRQQWIAPSGGLWADVEFLLPYYPDPREPLLDPVFPVRRPGEPARSWGPAELRATWTPGVQGEALAGVRVETRIRQDLHRAKWVEQFARLSVRPHERVEYGLAFRRVEGLVSQLEGTIDWRLSSEWGLRLRQPWNFRPGATKRSEAALLRYGHDFVFEFGAEYDQAGGSRGVFFRLMPRFLADRPAATKAGATRARM